LTDAGESVGYAVAGHKGVDGGIDGSVTRLSSEGEILWNRHYGDPVGGEGEFSDLGAGNPKLIYDECRGFRA